MLGLFNKFKEFEIKLAKVEKTWLAAKGVATQALVDWEALTSKRKKDLGFLAAER